MSNSYVLIGYFEDGDCENGEYSKELARFSTYELADDYADKATVYKYSNTGYKIGSLLEGAIRHNIDCVNDLSLNPPIPSVSKYKVTLCRSVFSVRVVAFVKPDTVFIGYDDKPINVSELTPGQYIIDCGIHTNMEKFIYMVESIEEVW